MGKIRVLRIEIDSHFHGSSDVPRPWVARIDGPCPKYGLARTFVDSLNDWSGADRTFRGRSRGVVACFSLRGGNLYEVSRLRGKSSKRHVSREFFRVPGDGSAMEPLEAEEALAAADPCPGSIAYLVPDHTRIAVIHGLGTPTALGFIVVDGRRRYQLRPDAVHEVVAPDGVQRLVLARGCGADPITSQEALQWLQHRLL